MATTTIDTKKALDEAVARMRRAELAVLEAAANVEEDWSAYEAALVAEADAAAEWAYAARVHNEAVAREAR